MNITKKVGSENRFPNVYDEEKSIEAKKRLDHEIDQLIDSIKQIEVSDHEAIVYLKRLSNALKLNTQDTSSQQRYKLNLFFEPNLTYRSFLCLLKKCIKIGMGLLLIILGVAMIIMPAPFPAFEIATIYYFNAQDGITIMDLISLLIIFYGIHGIIETLLSKTTKRGDF